ncbi:hypothetical protein J3F83DRAFT_749645 [Trichoderma novae-zelandiae]
MAAPLIWINAFPGTGKLTIAKAIKSLDESVTVIDNHQLIDPVALRVSRDDPRYQVERKRERERAFERHVYNPAMASKTVIFTDFQSGNQLGRSVANEYLMAAKKANRPFVPVYLDCDLDVNIERATSHDRMSGTTTKLTDAAILRDLRSRCKLFEFEGQDFSFWIDTTDKEPGGVAKMILWRSRDIYQGK